MLQWYWDCHVIAITVLILQLSSLDCIASLQWLLWLFVNCNASDDSCGEGRALRVSKLETKIHKAQHLL